MITVRLRICLVCGLIYPTCVRKDVNQPAYISVNERIGCLRHLHCSKLPLGVPAPQVTSTEYVVSGLFLPIPSLPAEKVSTLAVQNEIQHLSFPIFSVYFARMS